MNPPSKGSVVTQLDFWNRCLVHLQDNIPKQHFNTLIMPLQAQRDEGLVRLLAPNNFVLEHIKRDYLEQIHAALARVDDEQLQLHIEVGGSDDICGTNNSNSTGAATAKNHKPVCGELTTHFTFDNYVEGKSNQLAKAASLQVAKNPGTSYNPLFIYGGTGLGKTHLMQAIGHTIHRRRPNTRLAYLHSERFTGDMVKALQNNTCSAFQSHYRSLGALLIDDIQFLAGKERTQEEFFHVFNALTEGRQQIVLTCDRYPKEVKGLEERLKSRFGCGLAVAIAPPELETRVAIINKKASQTGVDLPREVAFFIAERFRSNIRELEGALNRVVAAANFSGQAITVDTTRLALRDLLLIQDRLVSMENIQKVVAGYFNIRVADMLSKRRSRSITRPRQIAMALAKALTNHSLPEIGDSFGGRDHTTVLHACRRIALLRNTEQKIREDYTNLLTLLTN